MNNLSELSKRELKVIADKNGVEYKSNIGRDDLEQLLIEKGFGSEVPETTTPETETETETSGVGTEEGLVETVEAPVLIEKFEAGTYEVISNVKIGGKLYLKGSSVHVGSVLATQLIADGVIK